MNKLIDGVTFHTADMLIFLILDMTCSLPARSNVKDLSITVSPLHLFSPPPPNFSPYAYWQQPICLSVSSSVMRPIYKVTESQLFREEKKIPPPVTKRITFDFSFMTLGAMYELLKGDLQLISDALFSKFSNFFLGIIKFNIK